jgi:AraC family transcriptional regulator
MDFGAFGARLGLAYHVVDPPTLTCATAAGHRLAVTEIRCDTDDHGFTDPLAREEAYLIALQLRNVRQHELWLCGQEVRRGPLVIGTTCFYDLTSNPVLFYAEPFHSLQFYLPKAAILEAAADMRISSVTGLRYSVSGCIDDPVILHLGNSLRYALAIRRQTYQVFVEYVLLALCEYIVRTYGRAQVSSHAMRGGLAPWQERRVKELIRERLVEGISLAEISETCELSPSALVRAFKRTTGTTPHQWLVMRRIDLAVELMRNPQLSLTEIAMAVGFADQSHFTRVFVGKMGVSPGAWRSCRRRP